MKENKMGVMPIPKLVLSMSLPAIFSMLVQALYNVVDSIFVARISETDNDALAALTLAFPIQLIVVGVFVGLGVGISSMISRKLGEHNHKEAVMMAENGILLAFILSILVAILGFLFVRPFFEIFTENMAVLDYATTYGRIIMVFAFGRIFTKTGSSIMQGTGEMVKPMISMLIGAILNIILDPIFIFGFLFIPAMGVKGAAIATVIAQIVAMTYIWLDLIRKDNIIKPDLKLFKPKPEFIRQILTIGIPVALMQVSGSIMLSGINWILSSFGTIAITIMGVYFRLQTMVFMPIFGLSTGTLPIVGYNFGAKNRDRVKNVIRFSTLLALGFMTFCLILFQLFPAQLLALFNPDKEMLEMGVIAFRRISLIFPPIAITIIISTVFQAFGKAHYSLLLTITRQIIVLLPIAYLLNRTNNVNSVWFSFVIAEITGVLLLFLLFKKTWKESIDKFN